MRPSKSSSFELAPYALAVNVVPLTATPVGETVYAAGLYPFLSKGVPLSIEVGYHRTAAAPHAGPDPAQTNSVH